MATLAACAPVEPATTALDTTDYSPAQLNVVSASEPVLREAYADQSPVQIGELRLPDGDGPFPVVMLVHGGCWNNLGSINNFGPMADWLGENGVASWNIDYRELGNGGGWPESFVDWGAALARLGKLGERYPLDLERITVMGHSAGTTPAVWLGMADHGDLVVDADMPEVRAAILLDGPLSLTDWVGPDERICGAPVIPMLMGGTPAEEPERYAMVEPAQNAISMEEMLVVVGSLPGPPDGLESAMATEGVTMSRIDLDGTSHFNLLVPGTPDFARIAPSVLRVSKGE